ncbi:glycerophosphodiester phosphodiesterase [Sulfobacillus harzensis]|uniref:GP-PDE domain-containing protein n=1 Tax=Sulfobacillus harzensis TaxID=2729629 RepID=A0A7Y0L4G5_9FIRM|nr:glycerophosphodiester phosphodiesterase family protein [Sulfobacillus harzensis]NMP23159.1 hypothetical protein [Sulfobacillus harzensis]
MWIIAHRGGGELFPENTLKAFKESQALGVDMVECDVHVSGDGELMVIHDATLERTGGKPLKVGDLTAEELSRMDVGDGEGVPTLSQLLEVIDIPVVVEIKTPAVIEGLLRLLSARPELTQRIVPISFYHRAIQTLVDRIPGIEGGVLLAGVPVNLAEVARAAHVRLLSLHYPLVTKDLVDAMHRENVLVSVWTPNTKDDIRSMVDAGVDGIASDRPDWVIDAVKGS